MDSLAIGLALAFAIVLVPQGSPSADAAETQKSYKGKGSRSKAYNPHGEDSKELYQINLSKGKKSRAAASRSLRKLATLRSNG